MFSLMAKSNQTRRIKKRRAWPDWPIKAFPKITAQSPTTEGPVEGRGETPFGFDVIF